MSQISYFDTFSISSSGLAFRQVSLDSQLVGIYFQQVGKCFVRICDIKYPKLGRFSICIIYQYLIVIIIPVLVLHLVDNCSLLYQINSRFPAGWKIKRFALSAALKPTAARDLEPRSKQCVRRPFPK